MEKWHQFVFGRCVIVRTEHKPLEAITKKPLDRAPRRLQGILLRSLAYDIEVQYILSHIKHLADMMSRSYLPTNSQDAYSVFKVMNAVQFFPMGQETLQKFWLEKKKTILKGWPEDNSKVPPLVSPYNSVRDELGIYDGLVFRGGWLVVLQGFRTGIKRELHASHAGMDGCLRSARECRLAKYELWT